jgi:tetratricopeptide (TPR) repeat protein
MKRNFGFGAKVEIRNSKLLLLVLLPALLLSCGALWQTDANRAVEQARTGQYKDAAAALERAVEGGNVDPQVVESLYYSWIRQGEYAKAREKFDAWASARANAGPIRLAAGRINRIVGEYQKALTHFDAIQNAAGIAVAAQFEKAKLLDDTGKRPDAEQIYNRLIQGFLNGTIRSPNDSVYVAEAMWAMEYVQDANDVFKAATKANPRNADAFLAWGDMLAEKYQESIAIDSYQDALKIDPNMPEAHLGLARLLALTDPQKSEKEAQRAVEVNPNFPDAHIFLASELIDSEQYDKAESPIAKVFEINPQSTEAFSLLASINYLRGNTEEFNKYAQKVLAIDPLDSDFYYTIAENSVSVRKYKEAVGFAREALRLNPRDWRAQSLLGVNLLRLGEEQEGKEALEKAYENDKFDVSTVNTLRLLDSFNNFDRIDIPNFHVKLHKKESAPLQPYVTELLEKAYKTLSAKYEFTPEGPITFEMYPDHGDFAVRTLGLPGIGALGVCFGKVFVMDSPSARKPDTFNWGSTLWHEFTHVITLQMTDHNVPRWFSEGLSVYEERKGFPGWGDDLKLEYLAAIKGKKLLPTGQLNDGFIRPRYPEQVLVSYYQASLIADYIEQKFGFPAIRHMLMLYKAARTTEQVFKEALNLSLADFDTQFFQWVDERTKDIDEKAFTALVSEGQQSLAKGDNDKAIETLTKAIQMYPEYSDEHNPYEPLAEAYLKKGDKRAAIDTLKKFMTYSETSYASSLKLAELLQEDGDVVGARQALEGAVYIRPLDADVHQKLGTLLLGQKQYAPAVREYQSLLALNAPDQAATYYHLAEAQLGAGKRDEARRSILKCLEIAPSYEPAQELLLKIRS